jgi:hypothetical protein
LSVIQELGLDLTAEEKAILYEFTRARQVMETLNTPGWEHIQDLMDSKISTIETKYLEMKNLNAEALWAMHIAVQYVREFVAAVKAQLLTTGDFLKDPQAIQAMINQANVPQEADLEGELPNPLNPIPED